MTDALPDLAGVLEPLPGPAPAGVPVLYDPVYDAIREARRQDDTSLPTGVWQSEAKRADWAEVTRLCLDVLRTRSKDLQVACWLVEALVYRHGFGAFPPGLRMIGELCRRFWSEGLHPANEGNDFSARFTPLEWLDRKLSVLLCVQAVTRPGKNTESGFSYSDYCNAQRLGVAGGRDPRVLERAKGTGQVMLADVEAAANATLAAVLRGYSRDLGLAIAETAALSATLRDLGNGSSPSMVGLRERLTEIQGWIRTILVTRGEQEEPMAVAEDVEEWGGEGEEEGGEAGPGPAPRRRSPSGEIASRDEAYYWVAAAADYLLRTEPHSPTPYLLQRAILWGGMPLHEILMEISRGRNDLSAVIDFLGFNVSGDSRNTNRS